MFLMDSRTAWNDYFTESYTTILNSQTYNSQQSPSGTGVYVSNCLFRSITSSSRGGALYSYYSVTYFLIESSSFFSCKTSSGNGGAIYYYSSGGHSYLHEVCGYDCCTSGGSYFQFAYARVNDAASSKNNVNYSSIARCVNENSNSWYTLCHDWGKQCCSSVNSSMNKCGYRSGINFLPSSDPNSVICSVTYSTFTDNIATVYTCISLNTGGSNYEIKSCNVLRNTQSSSSSGIIYSTGNLMINDSCILDNNATNIFYQESTSYTITLFNCTVDSTSNNGYLTTRNTVTKSFILALNHMSTQNCHSEYDSAGTLTPIIQSPPSSKNRIQCYTCNQSRIRDFVSLLSVFLFSFIHLDASNYPLY
jgi:hypothetical protein